MINIQSALLCKTHTHKFKDSREEDNQGHDILLEGLIAHLAWVWSATEREWGEEVNERERTEGDLTWRKKRRRAYAIRNLTSLKEKKNTGVLCKHTIWQQNEQDEEEHGTGEEKGSQQRAANSFCDFRCWRWKLHVAQHQKVTRCADFQKDRFV